MAESGGGGGVDGVGGRGPGGGGPGGGGGAIGSKMSYSDRLKTNVNFNERLKRNVLEIQLEKTNQDANINVDSESIARVFRTLGIDIVSQVEGHQVQYRGRVNVICVWMKLGVALDRFCKDVNIRVAEGVITGAIRPAGKKDVTVSITGLDFNTRHLRYQVSKQVWESIEQRCYLFKV